MNIDSFFAHYGIEQNPFNAEEARLDPVFDRIAASRLTHPDFAKILGRVDHPSTSIVFGEKGSGKTAIRLLIARRVEEHNAAHPDKRVLVVEYDDLNPVLDRLMRSTRQDVDKVLESFRLEDHQDAILSRAVTKLVESMLNPAGPEAQAAPLPDRIEKLSKKLTRQSRADLAVLAALYDQPRTGSEVDRWRRLRSKLRLGWRLPLSWIRLFATAVTIVVAGLLAGWAYYRDSPDQPAWLMPALGVVGAGAILLWGYWAWRLGSLWWLCRKIAREMPTIDHTPNELVQMLGELGQGEITRQPFPLPVQGKKAAGDPRYQLTRRLVDLLRSFGYAGMIILVDRVDEPTLISGNADKMRRIVWPMLDNKFLQQEGVGVKLLLPIELRHLLHRESPEFFQEARLDKQNMIDRLTWSGATLYDICSARLRACRKDGSVSRVAGGMANPDGSTAAGPETRDAEPGTRNDLSLTDLFEPSVTREMLIDALDQMHQPRDAFKFLYQVIQEHCRLVPEDQADFKIARLTLDSVRRMQSQRVQELYRGLTPA